MKPIKNTINNRIPHAIYRAKCSLAFQSESQNEAIPKQNTKQKTKQNRKNKSSPKSSQTETLRIHFAIQTRK